MATIPIDVKLNVSVADRRVLAHLVFSSGSNSPFYLYKINAFCSGKVENNLFRVTANNTPVDYIGIYKKRRAPGPDDFIRIEPKDVWELTVDITDAYRFPEGLVDCEMFYEASQLYPGDDQTCELSSNRVRFQLDST